MVQQTEVPAVNPTRNQGMMRGDHYQPAGRAPNRRAQGVHNLRRAVGRTTGSRVFRLGSTMKPPLGIEQDQPEPTTDIRHARPWTTSAGSE